MKYLLILSSAILVLAGSHYTVWKIGEKAGASSVIGHPDTTYTARDTVFTYVTIYKSKPATDVPSMAAIVDSLNKLLSTVANKDSLLNEASMPMELTDGDSTYALYITAYPQLSMRTINYYLDRFPITATVNDREITEKVEVPVIVYQWHWYEYVYAILGIAGAFFLGMNIN